MNWLIIGQTGRKTFHTERINELKVMETDKKKSVHIIISLRSDLRLRLIVSLYKMIMLCGEENKAKIKA